ncbi:hypothetical protein H3T68_gp04 [Enterococcus phage vB_EfaP_Efmus4]|uniref:Uncharacterized protein n=1 Tax=Enterococcus phage vB_EfaP_Efmus4 TaxID=2546626 RepID=A0A4D6DTC8_9CAUD|nr:hypothetical protein H3T68_gp04 [Enterococcus phage vB_EfaP_Efmus4]QBZ69372.1 hypothetical protein [Enterococcus phage vB_EfaP_Efmus4]
MNLEEETKEIAEYYVEYEIKEKYFKDEIKLYEFFQRNYNKFILSISEINNGFSVTYREEYINEVKE